MTVTETEKKKDDSRYREFSHSDDYQKQMDERFARIEAQFSQIAQSLEKTVKGKGKTVKGKGKQVQNPQPSVSEACAQRLRSYMNDIQGSRGSRGSSSTGLMTEDEDLPLRPQRNQPKATTKTVYIKKIDCQINNTSIDQGNLLISKMLKLLELHYTY